MEADDRPSLDRPLRAGHTRFKEALAQHKSVRDVAKGRLVGTRHPQVEPAAAKIKCPAESSALGPRELVGQGVIDVFTVTLGFDQPRVVENPEVV